MAKTPKAAAQAVIDKTAEDLGFDAAAISPGTIFATEPSAGVEFAPSLQLGVHREHPLAKMPTFGTDGSACFDLYAVIENDSEGNLSIEAGEAASIHTGLKFDIPAGHVLMVYPRSGLAFNKGLRLANCVGVIDSDYTGEVIVRLQNDNAHRQWIRHGDRIAQAMLHPVPRFTMVEIAEVAKETERGEGGFGSTGE